MGLGSMDSSNGWTACASHGRPCIGVLVPSPLPPSQPSSSVLRSRTESSSFLYWLSKVSIGSQARDLADVESAVIHPGSRGAKGGNEFRLETG